MRRILILLFSTLVATTLYAQRTYLEYDEVPTFLLSRYNYNSCHQPLVLKMQSSAHLIIDDHNDPAVKKIREIASSAHLVFDNLFKKVEEKTDAATFEIRVDPDSVYDESYKIYTAQFEDCKIEYVTYCQADKLSVVLNHKEYVLSCLDGGMDVHIKYLLHTYIPKREGENLCITITGDLPLEAKDKSTILLKKGSSFSFDVVDTRHK